MDVESDSSQEDVFPIDSMIGEEASKSAAEAQDANLFGPSVNDFIKSRKSGRRKKTGSKSRINKLPDALTGMYAEAQKCYILMDFNRAKLLLSELTKNVPEYAGIYNLLGLIYENENNIANACDCYFIAAEITKKDSDLWFQVYELSNKLNLHKRQLYCLSRLIHLLPEEASFYEKRYKLWLEDNQLGKATNDLLMLCKLSHDLTVFVPKLYELCIKTHREQDIVKHLESEYASLIGRLSILNDRITGVYSNESNEEMHELQSIPVETATQQLLLLLHSLYLLSDLYMRKKEYVKAINVVDQSHAHCSIQLPMEMAVVYSVSLLHIGRGTEAMEVIDSLQMKENFSKDVADLMLTLAEALTECHVIADAEMYLELLLTIPEFHTSQVYELLYECASVRQDSDMCVKCLVKALETLPENMNDKKQELAVRLSHLYDERGELLNSVEVANKYLTKSRHLARGKTQILNREEYRESSTRLFEYLHELPQIGVSVPLQSDLEHYVSITDPLIRSACSLDIPSDYYGHIQPNAEIVKIVHGLDIPVVLGQATFLLIVWNLTRAHCLLHGFQYAYAYLQAIRSSFRFADTSFQNTLLLMCAITSTSNYQQAADSLRSLVISLLASETPQTFVFFTCRDSIPPPEKDYVTLELSLPHLIGMLSLLLPKVNYSFSTNLFKQLQRLEITQFPAILFMGLIALYRNPTSCRGFLCSLESPYSHDPLVLLCLGLCDLTAGISRMNYEKRETLIRGFARIQEYALERERIVKRSFSSITDSSKGDFVFKDMYTTSVALPKELFHMEILYNVGRAFHQIGLFNLAVKYYQSVLRIADTCITTEPRLQRIRNMYSLEKAAAYNLCLILKASGARAMAVSIRRKYLCFG